MRSLFRHRDFRLLLAGQSLSTVGDRLVFVALGAVELLTVGSAIALGALAGALLVRDVRDLRRLEPTATAASR